MKVWLSRNGYIDDGEFNLKNNGWISSGWVHLHWSEPVILLKRLPNAVFKSRCEDPCLFFSKWLKATGIKIDGGEVYELDMSPGKPTEVIKEWTYITEY